MPGILTRLPPPAPLVAIRSDVDDDNGDDGDGDDGDGDGDYFDSRKCFFDPLMTTFGRQNFFLTH